MKRKMTAVLVGFALLACARAFGSGMLIPKDQSIPPLAIKNQRVNIRIKDGTATAAIEQVFRNSVNRDLEAEYVFPLPENATIADFAMYIGGKRVSGELVEKNEARRIYEDIVRRMKDPGLLEHMGGNLFRVRVYPVPKNGEQKIEISYSQTLEFEAGLYKYVYPLKIGEQASRTLEDFTVQAELSSAIPLKNIYSPSHKVGISRKGDNRAVIGFEEDKALLDRDFVLYYGVSKKDFGINLLTCADGKEDGFFMLMVAPTVAPKEAQVVQRDVSFVFDVSGSMAGEKIRQTREALKYCVGKLNEGDRFNIVRFNGDVEVFNDGFLDVNDKNRKRAGEFIDESEARGGTAIDDALATALGLGAKSDRPHVVVFLTDGKPTIGEDRPDAILSNIRKKADKLRGNVRIFAFGVGEDLNAHLLDRISTENGGVSQYVSPGEDIEVKVSSFADKISMPVLSKPRLTFDKLDVRMMHPKALADLFAGGQITVFGRYRGHGDYAIRLAGEINGKPQEFVYEGIFPKESRENDFIPRLWATRRVGYLLDEIRLHGEEKELRDEVVKLGKEYGIMTPYTSYLVLEDDKAYADRGIERRAGSGERKRGEAEVTPAKAAVRPPASDSLWAADRPSAAPAAREAGAAGASPQPAEPMPFFGNHAESAVGQSSAGGMRMHGLYSARPDSSLKKQEGGDAIRVSRKLDRLKEAQTADEKIAPAVRSVGSRIFHLIDGVWTDRDYKEGMKTIRVKYAGDEYFKLAAERPELKKYLALGEKVIVCLDDKTALIVE